MQACLIGKGSDSVGREVSNVTIRVLRLAMHGLLACGCLDQFATGDVPTVAPQAAGLAFEQQGSDPIRAIEFFSAQYLRDWDVLREHLEISDEDVALVLHVVLQETAAMHASNVIPATCHTSEERTRAEQRWERACVKPVLERLREQIDEARTRFQRDSESMVGGIPSTHARCVHGSGACCYSRSSALLFRRHGNGG